MYGRLYRIYVRERADTENSFSQPYKLYDEVEYVADWKLWGAIATSDWKQAKDALRTNNVASLPKFVCDALLNDLSEGNFSRISLLTNLGVEKLIVIWDLQTLDCERRDNEAIYVQFKYDDETMKKAVIRYESFAEQMKLVLADIHPDFRFEIPELHLTNSLLEHIESTYMLKAKPKLAKAFKELKKDKARKFEKMLNVIINAPSNMQLNLVADFLKIKEPMKNYSPIYKLEEHLLHLAEAILKDNYDGISKYVRDCMFSIEENGLSYNILQDTLLAFRQVKGISCISRLVLRFWDTYFQLLMSMIEGKKPIEKMTRIGGPMSITEIGEAGVIELADISISYSQLKADMSEKANIADSWKSKEEFTKAYIELYKLWDGKNMHGLFNAEKAKSIDKPLLARLIKYISAFNYPTNTLKTFREYCVYANEDLKNALQARLNDLQVEWINELVPYASVEYVLKSPNLTLNNFNRCMEALAIRALLKELRNIVYNELRIRAPSKDVDVEVLKRNFAVDVAPRRLEETEAFEALENDCERYVLKREDLIFKEEVARLGL